MVEVVVVVEMVIVFYNSILFQAQPKSIYRCCSPSSVLSDKTVIVYFLQGWRHLYHFWSMCDRYKDITRTSWIHFVWNIRCTNIYIIIVIIPPSPFLPPSLFLSPSFLSHPFTLVLRNGRLCKFAYRTIQRSRYISCLFRHWQAGNTRKCGD